MAKSQTDKQFTQMAGEFGVVSELHRRSIQATITYGNSKQADVFVISSAGDKVAKVEVKTSVEKKWIVDDRALDSKHHIVWVFVHLPEPSSASHRAQIARIGTSAPQYHVLTSAEVQEIYTRKRAAAKKPITFSRAEVESHLNQWEKVSLALGHQ